MELEITVVELEMKKKKTQIVEKMTDGVRRRQNGQKGGSGGLGVDRRRDGAARRRRMSLDAESPHRKMTHAPMRAPTRRRVDDKLPERGGACGAVFRRGCHRRVDRPRAPRNLKFPAGEELAGKSPAAATAAMARRSSSRGFQEENKVTGMKHDHQKSKLGFPFGSDIM